jgi:hypothetical protein
MTIIMPIGKYRDQPLTYIFAADPSYLAWFVSTVEGYEEVKDAIVALPDFDAHLTAYRLRQRNREWRKGKFSPTTVEGVCNRLFNGGAE